MTTKLNNDKTISIQAFSLRDFVFEIAKLAKAGYSPVDDNEKYPQGFVNHYHCTVVADDDLNQSQRIAIGLEVNETVATETNTETKDETSTEKALNDDSSPAEMQGGANVPEVKETPKTASKATPKTTKKTT